MNLINENSVGDLKDISALTGKTLLVYWVLLKEGKNLGVREIQRKLNFSSPSVVSYHLEKLKDLELVSKDQAGTYIVQRKANISELQNIIVLKLANRIILLPRFIFYAVFFTIIFIGFSLFIFPDYVSTEFIFILLFGGISTAIFWFETYRIYKNKPI